MHAVETSAVAAERSAARRTCASTSAVQGPRTRIAARRAGSLCAVTTATRSGSWDSADTVAATLRAAAPRGTSSTRTGCSIRRTKRRCLPVRVQPRFGARHRDDERRGNGEVGGKRDVTLGDRDHQDRSRQRNALQAAYLAWLRRGGADPPARYAVRGSELMDVRSRTGSDAALRGRRSHRSPHPGRAGTFCRSATRTPRSRRT